MVIDVVKYGYVTDKQAANEGGCSEWWSTKTPPPGYKALDAHFKYRIFKVELKVWSNISDKVLQPK